MHRAQLVGLSPDGRFLIIAADRGEELALPADARLRAAVSGDRPRIGQLEIEMESALTPREIQTRIRSGESLEDVVKVAGIPLDRVERFAAPVIAEREYVAAQAMAASVRRRGETSGHRNLRLTITERLAGRAVDLDTLVWDSYRMEDARWGVTASYRSGEAERQALFFYDSRGRFSVAGNDDARWILGEQSSGRGPQPGRRTGERSAAADDDVEPTLDLSDDLAIVRAVQDPPLVPPASAELPETGRPTDIETTGRTVGLIEDMVDDVLAGLAEESATAYAGLSDASAVPESATDRGAGWEPAIVVDYPIEPSQVEPADEFGEELHGTDEPGEPDTPTARGDREDEAEALEQEQAFDELGDPDGAVGSAPAATRIGDVVPDEAPAAETPVDEASVAEAAVDEASVDEAAVEEPRATPAKRSGRKRASVPSWDEIMFGAPKRP